MNPMPAGVFVFLHGHDDTPERWGAVAEAMAPAGWLVERPRGPVATDGGAAWFGADEHGAPVPAQVHAALDEVGGHLRDARRHHGVDADRVVLAGFSQGGAMALLHAVRAGAEPVAAVVAVAGWLPDVEGVDPMVERLSAARVLVAHGGDDEDVPLLLGRAAARLLERQGHDVTFVERDADHDPTPFAADVRAWLTT